MSEDTNFKTINVARTFKVNIDLGDGQGTRLVTVEAGIQKVHELIADHWYTQAHLVSGGVGTVEYAKSARHAADNAFHTANEAVEKYRGLEAAAQDAERAAGIEVTDPAYVRFAALRADGASASEEPPHAPPADPAPQEPGDVPDPAQAEETQTGEAGADSVAGSAGEDALAASAGDDAYPTLTDAQEKALDRDGDGKPGGAPAGGNKRRSGGL